jgi:hypothetical protein
MKSFRFFIHLSLILSLGIFSACNQKCEDCPGQPPSSDVTKPVITVLEPGDDQTFTTGDSIHFRAKFTDDRELGQYKIDIHSADDGHSHGKNHGAAPFFEYSVIVPLSGSSSDQDKYLVIPTESAAGKYHMIITAVDKAGNEAAFQEIDIYLINPEDTAPPAITMLYPDFTATEIDADFPSGKDTIQVLLTGTLTDTKGGSTPGDLYGYEITFTEEGEHDHKVSGEEHGKPVYKISNFNLSGSSHQLSVLLILRKADLENETDYKLEVVAVDRKNNRSKKEVKYHVHF